MNNEYFNIRNDIEIAHYVSDKMNNDYVYISVYDSLFSENESDILTSNANIRDKIFSRLSKLITTVTKFITGILNSIYNFINYLFTSRKVKKSFEKFKEECKKDPQLRLKKITITDYKKIMKEYDKKLEELTKEQYDLRKDDEAEIDTFVKNFVDEVNKISKAATTIVTVDAAEKIAIANHEIARDIANKLESDKSILKNIEDEIGPRNAKKFEKNIKRASNDSILIKLKSIIYAKKYKTISDVTSEIVNSVDNLISGNTKPKDLTNLSKIGVYTKNNDTIKPYINNVREGYKKGKKLEKEYMKKQKEDSDSE